MSASDSMDVDSWELIKGKESIHNPTKARGLNRSILHLRLDVDRIAAKISIDML